MTKFREGFMMKSPLPKHDAIMAEMKAKSKESSGRDDAPDFSNTEVVDLKKDYDKAKAEHNSPASMSPLNQGGYTGGGMSASDYPPIADLYMNMFEGIAQGAREYDENRNDPEVQARSRAMKAQRLGTRMDKIDKKQAAGKGDGQALDDKRRKLAKKQAEAKADQIAFEDIANKNKDNQFDKLFALMSKEDKEKYGLTTDTTT